jgi:hypothetical protein
MAAVAVVVAEDSRMHWNLHLMFPSLGLSLVLFLVYFPYFEKK